MRNIIKMLLLFLVLLRVPTALGDILVYDDCETAPASKGIWNLHLERDGKVTLSDKVARAGNSAYRFESYRRAEINLTGKISFMTFEKDYWLGYSFYLPPGYQLPKKWFGTLLQFHVRNDPCDSKPTIQPLAFFRSGSASKPTVKVLIYGESDKCTGERDTNDWDTKERIESPVLKIGEWNDVVVHVKFSYAGNGVNQVWINGEQFIDLHGIVNCAKDDDPPFFKLGTYTAEDLGNHTVVYFDEIRLGDENADYYDVAPPRKGPNPPEDLRVLSDRY